MSAPDWRREDATPQKGEERGKRWLRVKAAPSENEVRVRVLVESEGSAKARTSSVCVLVK